jgi:hypothetical protein
MEKHELERITVALFGNKPNHEDGVVGILASHGVTLYGTPDNPGGISKDIRTMKRWVGMASAAVSLCGIALVVMEFLNKVLPVFVQAHQ